MTAEAPGVSARKQDQSRPGCTPARAGLDVREGWPRRYRRAWWARMQTADALRATKRYAPFPADPPQPWSIIAKLWPAPDAPSAARHISIKHTFGFVASPCGDAWLPLTLLTSVYADDFGGAEGFKAVHECDADVDFGCLSVCRDRLRRYARQRISGSASSPRSSCARGIPSTASRTPDRSDGWRAASRCETARQGSPLSITARFCGLE